MTTKWKAMILGSRDAIQEAVDELAVVAETASLKEEEHDALGEVVEGGSGRG